MQLTPDSLKSMKLLHDDLCLLRLGLKDALDATDKHITVLIRAMNGKADDQGVLKATRKLYRAIKDLGEAADNYIKKWVRIAPKTAANAPATTTGPQSPTDVDQ
jgi:hypothetical protein